MKQILYVCNRFLSLFIYRSSLPPKTVAGAAPLAAHCIHPGRFVRLAGGETVRGEEKARPRANKAKANKAKTNKARANKSQANKAKPNKAKANKQRAMSSDATSNVWLK